MTSSLSIINKLHSYPKLMAWTTALLPLGITIYALLFLLKTITMTDISIFLAMYFFGFMGASLGMHRLFSHRSFEPNRFIKLLLGFLGSMSMQGPILFWTASHRRHHGFSDADGDPHSPIAINKGFINKIRSFFHAQVGWYILLKADVWIAKYIKDWQDDKDILWMSRTYLYWVLLGLVIPAIVGGLVTQSWYGAYTAFIWGGFVRIFFVNLMTGLTNTICHLFGKTDYKTSDNSKNNIVIGYLTFGEGWHNNHHAFPRSAKIGFNKYQLDVGYRLLKVLEKFGWVTNIQEPTNNELEKKIINHPSHPKNVHSYK